MITYNNILTALENFATNHLMVNSFAHGNVEEMDLTKTPEYPLMHVIYTGSDYDTDKSKQYGFEVYFVEAPIGNDADTDKQVYQREAVSDMEQIAEDLITDIRVGFNIFNEDFDFDEETASVIPIEEESTNVLSGVALSISISVPYLNDYCSAPLTGVTPTEDPCDGGGVAEDVVYRNSDSSFSVTIEGGTTYIAADITVTQANGDTSGVPSNVDVVCEFPSLTLVNSNEDNVGTVSTYPVDGEVDVVDTTVTNSDTSVSTDIPSGVTTTLPNIDVTQADGTTTSVPALVDVTCSFPELDIINSNNDDLGTISSYPVGGNFEVADTTVSNSDNSVTIDFPSGVPGAAFDIQLTEVDGSITNSPSLKDLVCAWANLTTENSNGTVLSNVNSYPLGGVVNVVDTPITNSDGSVTDNAPSGETYTTPDITLTEVDGSSTVYPSLLDIVAAWSNLTIENSVSTVLVNVNSYPAGGIISLPDVLVDVKNTDGTVIEANVDYENNLELELDDLELEDSDGNTFDRPVCTSIVLEDTTIDSVTVVGNVMTINTPSAATPSGIAYQNSRPMGAISYNANDSIDSFTDGDYEHTNPVYPVSYAKVDHNATQADVRATPATGTSSTDSVGQTMLEENNQFGNKYRYTDDAGNPSDATVGSNLWAHVDWNNHSWTGATQYYVIDHLENWGMTVQYADDSGTVNLNGSNDWAAWLSYISTVTWEGTYSGFIPLDMGDLSNAHGAKCSPNEVWADNFFEFDSSVSGSARGGFLTGESYDASNFYPIYDSGNADLVVEITKSISSGFQSRLTNIFMKRKHY